MKDKRGDRSDKKMRKKM